MREKETGAEDDPAAPHPPAPAPAVSGRLVVGLRVVLLLAAATVAAAAVTLASREHAGDSTATYVCPMHPEVRAAAPGSCPICRMALEPIAAGLGASPGGRSRGMTDTTAVENVRKHKIVDFVRKRSLPVELRELRGAAVVEADGTLTAAFYRDEIASFAADEPGTFFFAADPQASFAVRRAEGSVTDWDRSTARIRFVRSPATGKVAGLMAGQVGWIEVARKARDVLTVPASAVLQSPSGPYVLSSLGGGRFDRRPIDVGETFLRHGFAVVLGGLRAQEKVVSRATFFLEAERRSQAGVETLASSEPAEADRPTANRAAALPAVEPGARIP